MFLNKTERSEKSEQGFTLIEVLIAMAIFAIGILAVATMQISFVQGNASSRRYTEASILAGDRAEQLMALDYDDPDIDPAGNPHQVDGGNNYTVVWTVVEDIPLTNTKTINIAVWWKYRGSNKSVTLSCIRANT